MELLRLLDGKLTRGVVSREFDVRCDVLCVGAGSAGVYAADSAAKNGADVILVERDNSVGGMHILGNVRGCYYGLHGGSFEADTPVQDDPNLLFKVEKKRLSMLERLENGGVRLLFGCVPTGIFVADMQVVGVLVFDGQRELAIGCRVAIDATSDGFLLRMLPVEKEYGRPRDGKMAPYSVIATLCQHHEHRQINRDAGYINQYDVEDFSHKAILAHAQSADLLEKGQLLNLATHTGVREGLRFEGEERLRYEDILLQKRPEKILFWAYSDLDLHGHLRALDEDLFQTWWVLCNMATVALRIPVPMGAVIPKGWRGIATAGRCLSADSYAQAAVRMNRDCFRMGECVGAAAALAADGDLLAVDYAAYRSCVEGCFAGEGDKFMGYDSPHGNIPYRPVECNWEKNLPLLHTDTPGPLFWSAFCCRDKAALAATLSKLLEKPQDLLCHYNIGIALGILEDVRCLPILREMAEKRDAFFYKDCRRSNQFRSVAAVCLLGRLGEVSDVQLLEQIVFDPKEHERQLYHTLQPDRLYYGGRDRNFLYFDMFTHAAAALVKLHRRHGLPLKALREGFAHLLQSGEAVRRIVYRPELKQSAYEETVSFLEQMLSDTADEG